MGARMVLVRGYVQRADDAPDTDVIHLVAQSIEDCTAELATLSDQPLAVQRAPGDGATSSAPAKGEPPPPGRHRHPRDVRVIPKSRDFH
jgi:error-prone DNA polymerase